MRPTQGDAKAKARQEQEKQAAKKSIVELMAKADARTMVALNF